MSLRALLRRLALPPLAAGLAVAGLALPARADSITDFPLLVLDLTETITVVDGQSKTVAFSVDNLGGGTAQNTIVRFGSVPAGLGFVPPTGCTVTECKLDKLAAGAKQSYTFTVKPDTTVPLTSSFEVTLVTGFEELDGIQVQVVRTTKAGADLEIGAIKDLKVGRGKSANLPPVAIRNTGSAPSKTLGLFLGAQDGVAPDMDRYRNCELDTDEGGVICVLDQTLAPGQSASVDPATPLAFKVGKDTPGPASYYAGVAALGLTDKYVAAFAKRNAGKTGDKLALKSTSSAASLTDGDVDDDLNPDDNVASFKVTAPMAAADGKAVGGVFSGAAGDRVTVKVGTQNLGPFATVPLNFTSLQYVHVQLPTGITLTKPDELCLPGTSPDDIDLAGTLASRDWVCLVLGQLHKGDQSLFAFTASIGDGSHDAGFVQTAGSVQDTVSGNNRAALTVEAQDSLPLTGPSAGLLAGGGALLLAAGLFALRMARRRRIITVVD
ncbi:hypothetical protein [Actinoplanes sp. NPDC020271]|uniref:hypothetical protein n=1 Tax=Actinoplanes sp. NPDC020271 TaxID=3363896 RepID=UPI0037BDAB40